MNLLASAIAAKFLKILGCSTMHKP